MVGFSVASIMITPSVPEQTNLIQYHSVEFYNLLAVFKSNIIFFREINFVNIIEIGCG